MTRTKPFIHHGEELIPGVNVDAIDIGSGLKMAEKLGYGDGTAQMVAQYALQRHQRGEEEGAMKTWLSQYPQDLTSWYAILAAAMAGAVKTCRDCGAPLESHGDKWVDARSGDDGGTFDICPERYDEATDTQGGHRV